MKKVLSIFLMILLILTYGISYADEQPKQKLSYKNEIQPFEVTDRHDNRFMASNYPIIANNFKTDTQTHQTLSESIEPQPIRQPVSGEIVIRTPEELAKIGVDPAYPLSGKYILMANLDLSSYSSGEGWVPIGTPQNPFTGTFDGNGLVIKNLTINRPSTDYQGLFGETGKTAKLLNISLKNVNVIGCDDTGSLVGDNSGTIENSCSVGSVEGGHYTGGLVGYNSCTTTDSSLGYNPGTITSSYFNGSVTGNDYATGGLVGGGYSGVITNSYSTGSVKGNSYNTGGLVGFIAHGTITSSYFNGSVTGAGLYTGGLVGWNEYGTIKNSYSRGSVTGINTDTDTDNGPCPATGGLVGHNSGTIENSYSISNVKGGLCAGGLVGWNTTWHDSGTIKNSYSAGSVEGGLYTGGLVGFNQGTITSSYWDTQTSDITTSAGGVGKTTVQMKQRATFVGWDFTNIWAIDEGVSYPYLRPYEQILVNGTEVTFLDAQPYIKDNRTLVPIRFIVEQLGAQVGWDEKNKQVTIEKDGKKIILKIGSKDVSVNNSKVTLDVPAEIKDNRTMVPLRFISEAFGAQVGWDRTNKVVTITTK
jgi:hypothetical protein